MWLEVVLDGKIIYRSSFSICRASSGSNPAEGRQRIIAFYFKGGHVFQGEYHTARAQIIEGNIWQAGADPDAVLLGVSFSSKKQVLLNTIHVAKPDSVSASEIGRGIVVRRFHGLLPDRDNAHNYLPDLPCRLLENLPPIIG